MYYNCYKVCEMKNILYKLLNLDKDFSVNFKTYLLLKGFSLDGFRIKLKSLKNPN